MVRSNTPSFLLLSLLLGCAASRNPVPVVGTANDVGALAGEWVGDYQGNESGRSGTITSARNTSRSRAGASTPVIQRISDLMVSIWESMIKPRNTESAVRKRRRPMRIWCRAAALPYPLASGRRSAAWSWVPMQSCPPHGRRGFLWTLGGALGATLLPRRGSAQLKSGPASGSVVFTDVTAAAGLSHATNVSGSAEDKQLILVPGMTHGFFDLDPSVDDFEVLRATWND